MSSLIPRDVNAARREMRGLLLHYADVLGLDLEAIPHSYDSEALIRSSRSALATRRRLDGEAKQEFRAALAFVLRRGGDVDGASELLDEGIREALFDGDQAYFHYLRASLIFGAKGQTSAVREEVQRAIDLGQMGRRIRAWAQVLLAESLADLGYHAQAREAVREGLSMRVNEVNPALHTKLANIAHDEGDLKEAHRLIKRARKMYLARRNENGVATCDAFLAAWHLRAEEWQAALDILDAIRPVYYRTLNLRQLAVTDHNRGYALARLAHYDEALASFGAAARLHNENGSLTRTQETLRAHAMVYSRAGEIDVSLAHLHVAAEISADLGLPTQRFRHLQAMLEIMARNRTGLKAVPYVLSRAYEVLEPASDDLDKKFLLAFTQSCAALGYAGASVPRRELEAKPRDFPKVSALGQARSFASVTLTPHLDGALREQIATSLPQKWQSRTEGLVGFLLGFVGDWFRNGDYQQEFLISQGNAKHHLRELRAAGLIEQQGIKKGAKYHLNFHIEQSLFADPVAEPSS